MVFELPSMQLITNTTTDDDNVSISSTFSVRNDFKVKVQTTSTDEKIKKTVRFASPSPSPSSEEELRLSNDVLVSCIYYESTYTVDDVKKSWYKHRDYKIFRMNSLESSQQIIATEKRNRAPYSYQRVMERTYTLCKDETIEDSDKSNLLASSNDMVHLQRWLEVASSRIGLEKWSIIMISNDKSVRRKALSNAVLNIQEEGSDIDSDDNDNEEEIIRKLSQSYSKPSCNFAYIIANALAAAVQKENNAMDVFFAN